MEFHVKDGWIQDSVPLLGRDYRFRDPDRDLAEDREWLARGLLTQEAYDAGYIPGAVNFQFIKRSPKGEIESIGRAHNLRVNQGRQQQLGQMFGDIQANVVYTGNSGLITGSPSSTQMANSGATFPTSGGFQGGLVGHMVMVPQAAVFGVILSQPDTHTLNVDQWTSYTSTIGAPGSNPSAGQRYWVSQGLAPFAWIGFSTSSLTPQAGDILRTADGLFGDGSATDAATELTTAAFSGLGRFYAYPTSVAPGIQQYQATVTYLGVSAVIIAKAILTVNPPVAGGILGFETLSGTLANFATSGETGQVTWVISL